MIIVILNNIRSTENVGSIFRTCNAAGVSKIFLVGITPTPIDRFSRPNNKLIKASLGAEKSVSWESVDNLKDLSEKLKQEGYKIFAIEQSKNSLDYKSLRTSKFLAPSSKLALVFGNEVDGISKEDLELCDEVFDIPMRGKKESLNVSVTAGIIIFSTL